jgi:hypothetical protein
MERIEISAPLVVEFRFRKEQRHRWRTQKFMHTIRIVLDASSMLKHDAWHKNVKNVNTVSQGNEKKSNYTHYTKYVKDIITWRALFSGM